MHKCGAFVPSVFEGHGDAVINGERISYRTVSEDCIFYDDEGHAIASIFSFSYFREGISDVSSRPVVFAFNGGPGTSSCMLHSGFLGPKRVKYGDDPDDMTGTAPYEAVDNPECLLDAADIVLVDPVGTGFGVLLDESRSGDFYGIEEDAEAFLCFVRRWLSRHGRWMSPKYIIGESYGCTRAATAAGIATRKSPSASYDIAFDGIFFIGSTVTTGRYFNREVPAERAVLALPTFAAVNWYHNTDHSVPLEKWVEDAAAFADSEYVLGLYRGSRMTDAEKRSIKEHLMHFTGVSERYLDEHDLRIDVYSFRSEVARGKGRAVSKLDGRLSRPLYEPESDEYRYRLDPDAVSRGKYNPYFLSVLQGSLFPVLGIDTDRPYVPSAPLGKRWNYEAELTTAEHLYNAMQRVPGMRVFFAGGYYDMTTELGLAHYMLSHAHLPMDRVSVKGYPSGHMIYIGNPTIRALSEDIRAFMHGQAMSVNKEPGIML